MNMIANRIPSELGSYFNEFVSPENTRVRFIYRLLTASKPLVGVALAMVLAGCGPTREQCESLDWYATGWETGEQGRPLSEFDELEGDCRDHGIGSDRASFVEGYDEGISRYCTYDRGAELGRRGANMPTVCPDPYLETFQAGYDGGLALYCVPANAYQLGVGGSPMNANCLEVGGEAFVRAYDAGRVEYQYFTALSSLEQELEFLAVELDRKQRRVRNDADLTEADRNELAREIQVLARRHRRVSRELFHLRLSPPPTSEYR